MVTTALTRIPAKELQSWLSRLSALRQKLSGPGRPNWGVELDGVERRLAHPVVTVTFGGWQKSGKSSLVNGAIKRHVLSVDDLPETGTICRIIAGTKDTAVAHKNGRTYSVECSPRALRYVTALQPGSAPRRRGVDLVDYVDLVLNGTSIPANVCWIDPPGADDNADMTIRAREAADSADVLVFVNSSRHPLSDSETAFLTEHVRQHGPASVVLAVNAFLAQDSPEAWANFNARTLPYYQSRLGERAQDIGFTTDAPLRIYPVSARALASGDGALLGGPAFMHMLLEINSPEHTRVQRTRVYRASQKLLQLAEKIHQHKDQLTAQIRARELQTKVAYEQGQRNGDRFRRKVDEYSRWFVSTFAQDIRTIGDAVSDAVAATQNDVSVAATCRYDGDWNDRVTKSLASSLKTLLDKISLSIQECQQGPFSSSSKERLRSLVKPPPISIVGGRNDLSDVGKKAALLAGGAVATGSVVFGLLTFGIGGVLTAGAAGVAAAAAHDKAIQNAANEARNAIRADIDRKTNDAANHVSGLRDAVARLLLDACLQQPQEPGLDTAGHAEEKALMTMTFEAKELATIARKMAGAGDQL
jgi:hypothetical protein